MCDSRFDRTAELYVQAAREKDWSSFVDWCQPRRDDRALDVAAGPALLSAALLPHVSEAVAIDPSPALLAHAPPSVHTVLGRAEQLPFDDGSFELVTCVNGLHHMDDPAGALGEMARVLVRPGGRIVLQDYLADHDPRVAAAWERVERLRDPDHRRLPAEGESARTLAVHGIALDAEQSWSSTWQLEPWLQMAGCDSSSAERIRRLVGAGSFAMRAWRGRFRAG